MPGGNKCFILLLSVIICVYGLWKTCFFPIILYRYMIRRIVKKGVWVFALVIALPCYSQDNSVFAPFISQLKAEIRNNFIGISWQDSLDIKGPVFVYRSETPFSSASSLPVPIKEIPYGEGFYADEAEKPGTLYYFVAASDDWGYKYPLFLPNINMVSITVNPDNVGIFSPYPAVPAAPGSPRPSVTSPSAAASAGVTAARLALPPIEGISVKIEEDRALISFSGADASKNLILYRSINPIRRADDLLSAMIIRLNAKSPVVDYPLPGISYYYAVVYEDELGMGVVRLQPGSNVSGTVEIPVNFGIVARRVPLPGLSVSPEQEKPALDSAEAARVEASIIPRSGQSAAVPEAVIFPEDLTRGASVEEYQLRSIVQGSFSGKEWKNAEEEFRRFLELPRDKRIRAKAHFYLGQIYYFQNKRREALLSFLDAQDTYPAETSSWIQAVLGSFSK